jgi:membrane protein insertase Oxa1/YidC/SpoIIIJ
VFFITIHLPAALGLYWLVGGLVAYIQQSIILREDETELEALADKPERKPVATIPEAEVVASESKSQPKTPKPKTKRSKRRKRR